MIISILILKMWIHLEVLRGSWIQDRFVCYATIKSVEMFDGDVFAIKVEASENSVYGDSNHFMEVHQLCFDYVVEIMLIQRKLTL